MARKKRGRKKRGKLRGKAKAAFLARMASGRAKRSGKGGYKAKPTKKDVHSQLLHALSGGKQMDLEEAEKAARKARALAAFSGQSTLEREAKEAEAKLHKAKMAFSNLLKRGVK